MKKIMILAMVSIASMVSCEKEVESDTSVYDTTKIAVTGECFNIGCTSADVYIYVNTDSLMFQSHEDSNIAGVQYCQDGLFANGQQVKPIFHESPEGYVVFFDDDMPNRARCHLKNLLPGTTYLYRCFVKIGNAYLYGKIHTFNTLLLDLQQTGFVDLGLSVKWSSCNFGASVLTEQGTCCTWNEAILNSNNLPSSSQWKELMDRCACDIVQYNDVSGLMVTGPSGKSIFLPHIDPQQGSVVSYPSEDGGITVITPAHPTYGGYHTSDSHIVFSFVGWPQDNISLKDISDTMRLAIRCVSL